MPIVKLSVAFFNASMRKSSASIYLRFFFSLLGAVFLSFPVLSTLEAQQEHRFGLWVESEGVHQPFASKANFEDYLQFIANWGFTDLYCQVYRGGRSWFPSSVADDTPYRLARDEGFDPLAETIAQAKQRGQKVHAWVNVLRLFHNPDAPLLQVIGEEKAVQYDNFGNSVMTYDEEGLPGGKDLSYSLGTYGIWLDPSEPRVRRYLVETIADLVRTYPDLDGIHLDMVRYPTAIRTNWKKKLPMIPEYGFSLNSVGHFYKTSGRPTPSTLDSDLLVELTKSQAWAAWRRAQVTLLVYEIREMLKSLAPQMKLSAAVFADVERARDGAFQDWPTWMRYELLDMVVPMNYTRKYQRYSRNLADASEMVPMQKMMMGIGAWLLVNAPEQMVRQGKTALDRGSAGVVLFSYSNLFPEKGRKALDLFEQKLFAPTNHTLKNDGS